MTMPRSLSVSSQKLRFWRGAEMHSKVYAKLWENGGDTDIDRRESGIYTFPTNNGTESRATYTLS